MLEVELRAFLHLVLPLQDEQLDASRMRKEADRARYSEGEVEAETAAKGPRCETGEIGVIGR